MRDAAKVVNWALFAILLSFHSQFQAWEIKTCGSITHWHCQDFEKLSASFWLRIWILRELVFHLGTADLLFECRDVSSGSGSTSKPPLSISQPPSHAFQVITTKRCHMSFPLTMSSLTSLSCHSPSYGPILQIIPDHQVLILYRRNIFFKKV